MGNGYNGVREAGLNPDLSKDTVHKKQLAFMANNGLRQLGKPRKNLFADRQMPDPLHLEINNWEHVLNLLYQECVRRDLIVNLVNVLKLPISEGGCGLKSVAINIQEHFKMEKTRHTKLSNRLIGTQAINLSNYGLQIVDILEVDSDSVQMLWNIQHF